MITLLLPIVTLRDLCHCRSPPPGCRRYAYYAAAAAAALRCRFTLYDARCCAIDAYAMPVARCLFIRLLPAMLMLLLRRFLSLITLMPWLLIRYATLRYALCLIRRRRHVAIDRC